MIFSEKLQVIRKNKGFTQEELAEKLQVGRQAIAKWESGQAYPDILNLISLSNLFHVSVDYLVKDEECEKAVSTGGEENWQEVAAFREEAAKNTYAGYGPQLEPSRPASCDFSFERGDYLYIDTFVGGERFSGEEAIWKQRTPIWAMNYSGRVLDEGFSGDFLKEVLRNCDFKNPRGPQFYQSGEYLYQSKTTGDISCWFQGYEEIYYCNKKVYECFYHGGSVK